MIVQGKSMRPNHITSVITYNPVAEGLGLPPDFDIQIFGVVHRDGGVREKKLIAAILYLSLEMPVGEWKPDICEEVSTAYWDHESACQG